MGKIRIYTDESASVAIAEGLKRRGVDAFSARDAGNLGLTDEEQLIYANKEKLTIFTHDTDFLQIAARQPFFPPRTWLIILNFCKVRRIGRGRQNAKIVSAGTSLKY